MQQNSNTHPLCGGNNKRIKPLNLSNSYYWIKFTLKTSIFRYRPKKRRDYLARIMRTFKPNIGKPVFVVGAPRSGTTFLGECLSVLPEVSYHHEPVATKAAARYVYENRWAFNWSKIFYKTIYSFLMAIHFDADLRFIEKTPLNACIMLFLSSAFPQAKFIHIIRDGRDAALSYSKKGWHQHSQKSCTYEPGGYLYGPIAHFWVEKDRVQEFESTSDIHRSIWTWRVHTESAINGSACIPPGHYHEVRYESLVSNYFQESKKILDFLEIEHPVSRSLFLRATKEGKTDFIGKWKKELKAEDLTIINQEAEYLLKGLGYLEDRYKA